MDEQSEATLKKLLPELGDVLAPVAPDDALVIRFEDRWETFAEGRSARTMTADFVPSDDAGELGHMRGYFGEVLSESFRHLQFDDALSRDVYERDNTVVRIWRATTTHPLGYELDCIRVDVKAAVAACPLVFSEAFERYRARVSGGEPSGGLREHAMSLDDLAVLAVVTERLVIAGGTIDEAALAADGFRALSNGDRMKRQVGGDFELRVRYARAADSVTIETTMIRGGVAAAP